MNKLAVIAAFLALSSCATFSGDPESPDESSPRQPAPQTESEAAGAAPEPPAPEAPAPVPDPPADETNTAEELAQPETPPDPGIPRLISPPRRVDEVAALPAPSLPPAPDAPAPTARFATPGSSPTGIALPQPDSQPGDPQSSRELAPEPEPRTEPAPAPARDPEPEPAPAPEPEPAPRPAQPNEAPATARQPAPPVSGTREAAVGDEVRLSLGDGGWVYLGEESGEEGLSFRRRYSEGDETVFVFSVDEPGDYVVRFQRQDLDRGVFREERVAVEARPEPAAADTETPPAQPAASDQEAASPPVAEVPEETPDASAPSADLDGAYTLLDEGRREAALDAFLQSYPVGDPEVHALIARLAYELGRWETARSHWGRNLDADEPFASNARLGLFRTALETGDAESAWEQFRQLEEADAPTSDITEEELLRLGNLLLESSDPSRAVGPLEAYMEAGGTPDDPAELYYRLGRLHEERRNAREAMEYYRRVVEEFPLSRHWQPAEERVQYLRRHFFDIR